MVVPDQLARAVVEVEEPSPVGIDSTESGSRGVRAFEVLCPVDGQVVQAAVQCLERLLLHLREVPLGDDEEVDVAVLVRVTDREGADKVRAAEVRCKRVPCAATSSASTPFRSANLVGSVKPGCDRHPPLTDRPGHYVQVVQVGHADRRQPGGSRAARGRRRRPRRRSTRRLAVVGVHALKREAVLVASGGGSTSPRGPPPRRVVAIVLVRREARPVAGRGHHLRHEQRLRGLALHQDVRDEPLLGAGPRVTSSGVSSSRGLSRPPPGLCRLRPRPRPPTTTAPPAGRRARSAARRTPSPVQLRRAP